ncbi:MULTISPECIES: hypothetical protein [Brevibacillus]|uniref:Uncharacterized protein n=1 Tax=Brevibacillus centrosporus TaxID=54910 RepID=A0A1I3M1K5_9BACL|nr:MULTISPECIES: hypothetical protein [Brevibacillus]PSJ66954.1 hypothetical protein C7J99_23005 [Brevibacillus brevis]RED27767.1 hypothetical protein DES34_10959 [Brevibacillus brevis]TQK42133.1 hypothetical protein FB479_115125 [Brevibacillus sp. AG162]SFI90586.1 hypothetical protein SAMN05518846_101485 [Brevibacillus centrosporus]VEF86804.1 Uncharacterised protein [Brevibacillus brevis]
MLNDDAKEMRGWVLRITERAYPDPLSVDLVRQHLQELNYAPSEREVKAHLAYLSEKQLVVTETIGSSSIARNTVRLTAKGKDLLEGNIPPDAGINLGARF